MSAWAKVAAAGESARLSDIMSDQEFLHSDLSLAEEISFAEIQHSAGQVPESVSLADDDADFALALMLQEQMDEEENNYRVSEETGGNVRTAFPGSASKAQETRGGAEYEEAGAYDELDGCSDGVVEKAMRVHSQKKRVKGVDLAGRVSAKDFKSTKQGVLDPATNLMIFKMIQNGTLCECDTACTIKTGKEASVFYGMLDFDSGKNAEANPLNFADGCAVKIFRTTLNEFTNRADYYDGDHRFGKFNKIGSTRDAISKWAEKEFRNLMRVNKRSKLLAPEALLFKEHIVVMSFVGKDGVPAPQLREVVVSSLSSNEWLSAYLDTMTIIYSLYHDCKLVHGDLSEYNLLMHGSDVWVIDFGQAVDTSHPEHIAFMLRDIETVNAFFGKCGVSVFNSEAALSLLLQPVKVLDELLSRDRAARAEFDDTYDSSGMKDRLVRRFVLQNVE